MWSGPATHPRRPPISFAARRCMPGCGVAAMAGVGFALVAPVLALAIMLLIGERRPWWLAVGALAMPAMIWVFVVQILGRPLL